MRRSPATLSREQFWSSEYHLNVLIARYPKPVVAVMDGVVMGGGVGLSAHASHRIVTERSAVAMPEVGIGFFPDVGVSFLLARSPGYVGTHLVLTGDRLGAADAIYCGLADIHIAAASLAQLASALADCHTADEVRARLDEMSVAPALRPRCPRLGNGSIAAMVQMKLKTLSNDCVQRPSTRRARRSRAC